MNRVHKVPGVWGSKGLIFLLILLQIMIWNLDVQDAVLSNPVKTLDVHKDVVLSMSFNTDGSLLATACRDRKIRVIDPRAGTVLQVGWVQRFMVQLISPLGVLPLLGSFIAIKDDASMPCVAQGTIWCYCLLLSMECLLSLLKTGILHLDTVLLTPWNLTWIALFS